MTVPGMLDERVRWYRRTGTVINGFPRPALAFDFECWGRVDMDNAAQTVPLSPQAHMEVRGNASCTVDQYITVPQGGVCVANGQLYWHRGDWVVRAQGVRKVMLERITPEEVTTVSLVEDASTLGGIQLVETPADV